MNPTISLPQLWIHFGPITFFNTVTATGLREEKLLNQLYFKIDLELAKGLDKYEQI